MSTGDARLQELQFLARLEREGSIEYIEPYTSTQEQQMLMSLIYDGLTNDGFDVLTDSSLWIMAPVALQRDRARQIGAVLTGEKVILKISHRGRVRRSELRQQLRTGRDRDDTGLLWAKRHVLMDIAIEILSAGPNTPLSLVFLDMNDLKPINEKHGHPAGDVAIRAFFQAVVATLGQKGEAYRNGGDEVVVILPGVSESDVGKLLGGFVQQLGKEVLTLGDARAEVRLTASCGSATTTDPNEDAAGFLKRADDAEIRAKNKSRESAPRISVIAVGSGDAVPCAPLS